MRLPFFKKPKSLYKVEYVSGADIDGNKVTFDLDYLQDVYVEANDLVDAWQQFAKVRWLAPHGYVHKITKVTPTVAKSYIS